jgi:subtilisin family serine protease
MLPAALEREGERETALSLARKRLWAVGATFALLVSAMPLAVSAAPGNGASYLVGLRDAAGARNLRAAGFNVAAEFGRERAAQVITDAAGVARLQKNPNVTYVEPDRIVQANANFTDNGEIPWGLDAVDAPDVWDGTPGDGVTICILDTGFDFGHPDLQGVNLINSANFVNDGHRTAQDGNGHGTHVAGTIAAQPNGEGVVGVAYDVNLLIARVLGDDGFGSTSGVVRGINWCVDQGADILSLSLGSDEASKTEASAFQAAWDAGRLSIAASGNDATSAPHYPSAYPTVVAVGAVDNKLNLADFSNFGPTQEVVAPGVHVLSSVPEAIGRTTTVAEDGSVFASNVLEYSPTTDGPVTGPLVECGIADTTTSCAGAPASPWIALISRGSISFADKVKNVMAQGADAAIITNNDTANRDDVGNFTLGTATPSRTGSWIPSVSVSYSSGVAIRRQGLGQGSVDIDTSLYAYFNGTSMATPHVSAVAALAWSANPNLSNAQIRSILSSTATDLGARGRDDLYGWGLVQADAAVAAALATP